MRFHAKLWCGVADVWGATGVFKTRASGRPPSTGKPPAEGPSDAGASESTWPQLLAAAVVNLTSFSMGSFVAWPAMALPQLMSAESGLREQPLTMGQASWVAALIALGGVFFVPLLAAPSTRLDRKAFGYLTVPLLLAQWGVLMWSTSVAALYTATLVSSASASCVMLLVPQYVGETAGAAVRGALGCLLALQWNAGILCGYLLGACLPYRTVLYVNVAPVLLFAVCFAFVPETPYRLATTGRHQDARKALRWLRRGISEECLDRELSRLQASADGGGARRPLRELLRCRASRAGVGIVLLLFLNQQFCGTMAVNYYAVFIFNEAGGSLSSEVATIILGALQVVGGLLSTPLVDRVGRRATLFLSNAAVGTSVAILGAYLYLKAETRVDLSAVGWLPVSCLSVYVVMVAFGLASLPYVVISEIVAPEIRVVAGIAGYSVVSLFGGTMSKMYPLMAQTMGSYGTFWFFAAVCTLSSIIAWFVLPETKGRPIEDILKELNGGKELNVSIT